MIFIYGAFFARMKEKDRIRPDSNLMFFFHWQIAQPFHSSTYGGKKSKSKSVKYQSTHLF